MTVKYGILVNNRKKPSRLSKSAAVQLLVFVSIISTIDCVPQQIFIPGLNIGSVGSSLNHQKSSSNNDIDIGTESLSKSGRVNPKPLNSLPYRLSEAQINDLFQLFNANQQHQKHQLQQHILKQKHQQQQQQQQHHNSFNKNSYYGGMHSKNEPAKKPIKYSTVSRPPVVQASAAAQTSDFGKNMDESSSNKRIIPEPQILQHLNNDIEKYFQDAASSTFESSPSSSSTYSSTSSSSSSSSSSASSSQAPTVAAPSPSSYTYSSRKVTPPPTTSFFREDLIVANKPTGQKRSEHQMTDSFDMDTEEERASESEEQMEQSAEASVEQRRPVMAKFIDASSAALQAKLNDSEKDYIGAQHLANQIDSNSNIINPRLSFGNMINLPMPNQYIQQPQHHQQQFQMHQPQQQYRPIETISSNDCSLNGNSKTADEVYCNLFHFCTNGVYKPMLCPEGFLFSDTMHECNLKSKVSCGKRIHMEFDHTNAPLTDNYMNDYYNSAPRPKIINGSLECSLGTDGYFADPEFCNIYHHCLAGVDYAEQCPHQLVWNDFKKMCDWQTSVNCTGRVIPVAQGQTSFCTDKADDKYTDSLYCNIFHHCVGGIDNVVRCDGELQWNQKSKKCDWESKVRCMGKMLPSEKKYNSTFCMGKFDGPYAHEEYCNVYHVCESGTDNIRQCPNQLFWDYRTKRCDWSGKVECTGRTLITLSTDTTLFCMERRDGVYGDPNWCNVYHNCLSGVDFKTKCPVGLIWNETKKDCDWSDTTQCATGNFLRDAAEMDTKTFCIDKPNGKYAHEMHCNRYYVCQNGKDIIFTCQNNLRYNATKQECDWAVNVQCYGKDDYMWEGVKENFCKSKPDGNYPDPVYCNIFHQCQAATDYPKRCSNRLMFREDKGECDWEDKVDCSGKEKLIETSGLQDESKPQTSGDGKGRVTKFCMTKENGNYADLYYCNVYHNCHGGFDTVQYCANGLVWRQDTNVAGTCDWPLSSKIVNGVDCGMKKIFLIDKQSQVDIMATLRSDFCITRGEGLFAHTKYCDLYIHCTAQAVAITMECSPGLIFNEQKRECDYLSEDEMNFSNSSYCPHPKQILRPKPKADGTLMFNGNDVTGKFPTKFKCENKNQQMVYNDEDWCNIYHVCAGPRDNIFICPPGTVFNKAKQGCFDRYSTQICSGTVNYYKPNNNFMKNKPTMDNNNQNNYLSQNNNNNNNYEMYF